MAQLSQESGITVKFTGFGKNPTADNAVEKAILKSLANAGVTRCEVTIFEKVKQPSSVNDLTIPQIVFSPCSDEQRVAFTIMGTVCPGVGGMENCWGCSFHFPHGEDSWALIDRLTKPPKRDEGGSGSEITLERGRSILSMGMTFMKLPIELGTTISLDALSRALLQAADKQGKTGKEMEALLKSLFGLTSIEDIQKAMRRLTGYGFVEFVTGDELKLTVQGAQALDPNYRPPIEAAESSPESKPEQLADVLDALLDPECTEVVLIGSSAELQVRSEAVQGLLDKHHYNALHAHNLLASVGMNHRDGKGEAVTVLNVAVLEKVCKESPDIFPFSLFEKACTRLTEPPRPTSVPAPPPTPDGSETNIDANASDELTSARDTVATSERAVEGIELELARTQDEIRNKSAERARLELELEELGIREGQQNQALSSAHEKLASAKEALAKAEATIAEAARKRAATEALAAQLLGSTDIDPTLLIRLLTQQTT